MPNETTTTLKVSGWHCEGCTGATRAALGKVAGVKGVKTDLANGTALVTHETGKVTLDALEKAVVAAGYEVIK